MKNVGVVSYNIHCNFTNYGSALQSWALCQAINRCGNGKYQSKLVDYCPDILNDKDPLNPFKNMWDKDEETIKQCEMSMPAIKENYIKFNDFYQNKFLKTQKTYTRENFNDIQAEEDIDGFVCGSDTIFCIDEFGLDDGYYANYDVMKKGYTISYAASFGDSHFDNNSYLKLNELLQNFKAIGIREKGMVDYIKKQVQVEVKKVIDPTLLLSAKDYDVITKPPIIEKKYLLLYSRRKNQNMMDYAEKIAKERNLEIVEISLQAANASKHQMFYNAGVEEFLSLVKNAEFVVTNSYHGMIFSVQFEKEFVIFSREQCDTKITELLQSFGLEDRMLYNGNELYKAINYNEVKNNISDFKKKSWNYLKENLEKMLRD